MLFYVFFALSPILTILSSMSLVNVKICKGRSCSDRGSDYIEKRLIADKDFYRYSEDDVAIETCSCQDKCKEWPIVIFNNDVQTYHNPVKASEMLKKKIEEARKRLQSKNK